MKVVFTDFGSVKIGGVTAVQKLFPSAQDFKDYLEAFDYILEKDHYSFAIPKQQGEAGVPLNYKAALTFADETIEKETTSILQKVLVNIVYVGSEGAIKVDTPVTSEKPTEPDADKADEDGE